MKALFLSRAVREKVLLLAFTILAWLIWLVEFSGRARARWSELGAVRAERLAQQIWLENAPAIEAKAVAATRTLDPAKTINATSLLGELNTLAGQAGLSADIGTQRTERTSQLAFHTVQMNVRRADLAALIRFYTALSERAPYIGLEQFTLATDRANPGQLSAGLRVVSVEVGR